MPQKNSYALMAIADEYVWYDARGRRSLPSHHLQLLRLLS